MTTIAYKDGILAADSQGNWQGTRTTHRKVYMGRAVVAAGSGDAWRCAAIYQHIEQLTNSPKAPAGLQGVWDFVCQEFYDPHHDKWPDSTPSCLLVEQHTGRAAWLSGPRFAPLPLAYPFIAIGSGSEYALGAMAAGATAVEAVQIAASLDVNTGGHITDVNVKELPL